MVAVVLILLSMDQSSALPEGLGLRSAKSNFQLCERLAVQFWLHLLGHVYTAMEGVMATWVGIPALALI